MLSFPASPYLYFYTCKFDAFLHHSTTISHWYWNWVLPPHCFFLFCFVDPSAKVSGQYYQDFLLLQQMLPAINSCLHNSGPPRPWYLSATATCDLDCSCSWSVAAKQSWLEPLRLQHLEHHAEACIRDTSIGLTWTNYKLQQNIGDTVDICWQVKEQNATLCVFAHMDDIRQWFSW